MSSDQEIEAAAEALWLDANQRFDKPYGGWQALDRRVKDIWRTGARAALQAAERVRDQHIKEAKRESRIGESCWDK